MKSIFLLSLLFVFVSRVHSQKSDEKLIELGKAYMDYMFMTEPSKKDLKELKSGLTDDLRVTANFIEQTITTKNALLTKDYLTLPSEADLLNIYIVRELDANMRKEDGVDSKSLIDSLRKAKVARHELIDNYYGTLFMAVGNKNKPFDLSNVNLELDQYGLLNETEKGILYLRCMAHCGTVIWGYMNVVKPPNTTKVKEHIALYPKINGKDYFTYIDLYFPDFDMVVVEDKPAMSYKGYYIGKLYEVLISHLICLSENKDDANSLKILLLTSILKEEKLYKYTPYQADLEAIYKKNEE